MQALALTRSIMRPGVHTATCRGAGGQPCAELQSHCAAAHRRSAVTGRGSDLHCATPPVPLKGHLAAGLQVLDLLVLGEASKGSRHTQPIRLAEPACRQSQGQLASREMLGRAGALYNQRPTLAPPFPQDSPFLTLTNPGPSEKGNNKPPRGKLVLPMLTCLLVDLLRQLPCGGHHHANRPLPLLHRGGGGGGGGGGNP